MSKSTSSLTSRITLSVAAITAVAVIFGVYLRLSGTSETQDRTPYMERQLAKFFHYSGFKDIKRVHFTSDAGITGIQSALPECDSLIHAVIMPEGDEFLGLWLSRSKQAGKQVMFVYNGQQYAQFPATQFWMDSLTHSLTARLGGSASRSLPPVIALSFPPDCRSVHTLPWQHFIHDGERQ